jgi:hypothetical protein
MSLIRSWGVSGGQAKLPEHRRAASLARHELGEAGSGFGRCGVSGP